MSYGDNYIPGVPSVTELLAGDGYYDYPYQQKTKHKVSGEWDDPAEAKAYFYARGHWVNDCCDLIAQGMFDPDQTADTLGAIQNNNPEWWTRSWETTLYAYEAWLDRHPRRKLIGTQIYVHHKTLCYQGTLDQLWVLEPGEPETVVDLKCVSNGAHCPKATALQLAGYDEALGVYSPKRKRLGLALHTDGTFIEDWYTTNWRDYAAWRNLVQHHYLHGPKGEYR